MTSLIALFGILGALLLGAMSPGPSFVVVLRVAVAGSRRNGIAAALGMGVGGAIFAVLALVGLVALLQKVEWLFIALKVCGGLYLIYLGYRIWRGSTERLEIAETADFTQRLETSAIRSFWLGLATQLANPKTAVVYTSIFAVLLPANPSLMLLIVLPPAVLIVEAGWYALVATLFSASGPQRTYLRGKRWIDRLTGTVLGGLGASMIANELR